MGISYRCNSVMTLQVQGRSGYLMLYFVFNLTCGSHRYAHHRSSWNMLKVKSPAWTEKKKKTLFKNIMYIFYS